MQILWGEIEWKDGTLFRSVFIEDPLWYEEVGYQGAQSYVGEWVANPLEGRYDLEKSAVYDLGKGGTSLLEHWQQSDDHSGIFLTTLSPIVRIKVWAVDSD